MADYVNSITVDASQIMSIPSRLDAINENRTVGISFVPFGMARNRYNAFTKEKLSEDDINIIADILNNHPNLKISISVKAFEFDETVVKLFLKLQYDLSIEDANTTDQQFLLIVHADSMTRISTRRYDREELMGALALPELIREFVANNQHLNYSFALRSNFYENMVRITFDTEESVTESFIRLLFTREKLRIVTFSVSNSDYTLLWFKQLKAYSMNTLGFKLFMNKTRLKGVFGMLRSSLLENLHCYYNYGNWHREGEPFERSAQKQFFAKISKNLERFVFSRAV